MNNKLKTEESLQSNQREESVVAHLLGVQVPSHVGFIVSHIPYK